MVVLDIGLPHMNGYEVAREVRRRLAVPLVALTGYAAEPGTSSLFDRYLIKPVDPTELLSLLEELGRSRSRS